MAMVIGLTGRNAVVIGAGKGFGRSICLELTSSGANVFAVSRTEADLISLVEEAFKHGVRFAFMLADVRSLTQAKAIALQSTQAFGWDPYSCK
jgi:NAD(P)-dependent dehydrogenase (short-subunit alcohol dehydrogenase family)